MSSWAIVAIVAIAIWGFVEMYKARHGIVTDWAGNETRAPVEDEAAKRELEELRERIKVLERRQYARRGRDAPHRERDRTTERQIRPQMARVQGPA